MQLARRLGLRGPAGTPGVSLHKLRHSFAVGRLAAWAQQGVVVRDRLPALAVYLGHVSPQNTYWYLTATPLVLEPARAVRGVRRREGGAMTARAPLGPLLRAFFADHLLQQKAVSPQTIHAYRDAFRRLLTFLDQHRQRKPEVLTLDDLDAPVILAFLDYLEVHRGNSVQSRNARLAAIRSFVRFAALRTPESVDLTSRVLAIPRKRAPRRQVHYLTRPKMDAILAGCDRSTHGGRRDHVLLLTLYNTGARVSELIALRRSHVRFGAATVVQLLGKGRKERAVPLWTRTSRCLRQWFDEEGEATPDYAFRNARGDRLTRQGVSHLLDQACQRARERCPSLAAKRVSPHVVRHTTAMHLLQAGVDMATIALWLGHERLDTTHQYVEADLQLKERALAKLDPLGQRTRRFKADNSLLTFLASL